MTIDEGPRWDGDPESAWEPYEPSEAEPWDAARVAHLHRRAGFGATPAQLRRDLDEGLDASIRRLLDGEENGPDGRLAEEFESVSEAMLASARRDPTILRVRLAWLFRIVHGPHPMAERMTLAWHDHYATANRKVQDPLAMLDQNQNQRRLWDAPISELHRAMLLGDALQVWLDGPESTLERPNENLGREFLELFALGPGNYSEADVQAAARALTGFRLQRTDDLRSKAVRYDLRRHDDSEKTILGETGPWGPDDLVTIACRQPAAARHVARRLFTTFIDDIDPLPVPLVEALADRIRTAGDVDVRRGIETVIRSRLFHDVSTRGHRIKSPVEFAAGLVRCCAWYRPGPSASAVDIHLSRMGQTLLDPPGVGGWPGGLAWLNGPLLIARATFVAALAADPDAERSLRDAASAQGFDDPADWGAMLAALFLPDGETGTRTPGTFIDALRSVSDRPDAQLA